MVVVTLLGCGFGTEVGEALHPAASAPAAVRDFKGFPLYWLGPSFGDWKLSSAAAPPSPSSPASFIYGDCTPESDSGCAPPLEVQITPLCPHLRSATSNPVWHRRRVRGAPVGRFGGPVLFSRRAQVKVFAPDEETALRALGRLRSANRVAPVIDSHQPIPGARSTVLAGRRPCS